MRSTAKMPGFKPSDWPILAAGEGPARRRAGRHGDWRDAGRGRRYRRARRGGIRAVAAGRHDGGRAAKRAPFVHDEWGDNVLVDIKLEAGDLAAAKAAAAHVVERSFRMNRMHPLPFEGRACIANYR